MRASDIGVRSLQDWARSRDEHVAQPVETGPGNTQGD
jgi:hypothetical protein